MRPAFDQQHLLPLAVVMPGRDGSVKGGAEPAKKSITPVVSIGGFAVIELVRLDVGRFWGWGSWFNADLPANWVSSFSPHESV
ncbi:MAG: hypothetical protein U1F42_06950 [Candidatus Competibacteraceae bacterium]